MNRQYVYDLVRDHLMNQGEQSLRIYSCAYRGDNGRMCAIGCLIPDELYDAGREGTNVKDSSVQRAVAAFLGHELTPDDVGFLYSLQNIHDGTVEAWPEQLYDFAVNHDLRP